MKKFGFTSLPSYKINYFIQMRSWKLVKIFFFLCEITQHLSLKHIYAIGPLFLWLGLFLEIEWTLKKLNSSEWQFPYFLKYLKRRKGKEKSNFDYLFLICGEPLSFNFMWGPMLLYFVGISCNFSLAFIEVEASN